MPKDKRKKKFFQGMEHLTDQEGSLSASSTIATPINTDNYSNVPSAQHMHIRKDLIRVIVLISCLLLILIGLTILDKNSNTVQLLAEKITSLIIK